MSDYFQQGLIINVAPSGAVASPEINPAVPVTEDAIVADVLACARIGAPMFHLHVRDENAMASCDPQRFDSLLRRLRSTEDGRKLVICVTTSGRHGQTAEQRAAVLDLTGDARPDMASLTLSSLNFVTGASINSPDTIRFLAKRMLERGIRPELEVFDLGMINFAKVLIREGLIKPPYYFNLLLGNIAGIQAEASDLAALIAQLPADSIWSIAGIGRFQKQATALGCLLASGVRIGLEDNLWLDAVARTPATNLQLVAWIADLAQHCGRPLMSAPELRKKLSLERGLP